MAIKVSENGRLFTLQTKDSSYQMFADDKNVLLHLYYGEKIGEENLSGLIFCTDMGFAGNPEEAGPNRKYSLDTLPQEIPGSGVGDFRDDMIEIRHADGSFAADFRFDSFEILDHSYAIPGMPALYDTEEEKGETLVITMTEKASDIVLKLFYGVFEKENVITRAARLENHGKTAIELEKMLSFSMDLMYENYEMIYFSGRHAMERTAERIPVQHAKVEIGSTRGTSSHHYNPAVILCEEGAGETHVPARRRPRLQRKLCCGSTEGSEKSDPFSDGYSSDQFLLPSGKRRGVRYPAGNLKLFRNRSYQTVTAVS